MRNPLSFRQFGANDSIANRARLPILMSDSSLFEQNSVVFSGLITFEFESGRRGADPMKPAIVRSSVGKVNWRDGSLAGPNVQQSAKTLGQLRGIFRGAEDLINAAADTVVYRVQWIPPVEDGTEGGLIWGNTTIEPGMVGDEYFMTHGHFHAKSNRGEFYSTVQGSGYLLLMDRDRKSWAEPMSPGSLHYIDAEIAHRVVNSGDEPLRFVACWPSDAGHNYASIAEDGFSIRVICRDGQPSVIVTESDESSS
jgi:glucose-6-phosphate isomerase, archaeal